MRLKDIAFINPLFKTEMQQGDTNNCLQIDILHKQPLVSAIVHIEISLPLTPVLYLLRFPSNLCQFSKIKRYITFVKIILLNLIH